MIRINLLGIERQKTKKAPAFDISKRLTVACSLILTVTVGGVGWWYWSLSQASAQVDADIAAAQTETARLRAVLTEVQQFEARRTQLQQRVALIEQLRGGQSVPVQLLDHVSRSLPEMLWLTSLEQDGSAVTIEGRSTTLIGLSDFVGNLGGSALLQKPIEIIDSQVETPQATAGAPAAELIRFKVKASITPTAKAGGERGAAPADAPGGGN
jgi:type IV pilus assembly protein PilN